MIWLWKWLEDVIGKGLELSIIAELVGYAALNQIPMSLPLAVLLSTIMTYGKLGESIELTAIKSLGVSLWKVMRPILYVSLLLALFAFIFSNNVLPYTNGKLRLLLQDIAEKKPELSIPEGVFYEGLEGYTLRVGKKYPDKTLSNIIIFENKSLNKRFVTADSGSLSQGNGGQLLVLKLINGSAYEYQEEEIKPNRDRKYPLIENKFETSQMVFDLSSFSFERSDDPMTGSSKFKNLSQLNTDIDSLIIKTEERKNRLVRDLQNHYFFRQDSIYSGDTTTTVNSNTKNQVKNWQNIFDSLEYEEQVKLLKHATNIARNSRNYIYGAKVAIQGNKGRLDRNLIEWHRKFTLSVACILLFFVGAPFGAIVKKGGLGIPVIISAVIFILYHIFSIVGEKLVKSGDWQAYSGMWLGTLFIFPLGVFLTMKATSDSPIFDSKSYLKFFKRLFKKN
jgi:lipopolysaccharide export system permease protein